MIQLDAIRDLCQGHARPAGYRRPRLRSALELCRAASAVDRLAAGSPANSARTAGERVATLSKNTAEMLVLQFACIRAGAIFMPLNWRLAVAELEALVADAAPALLFCQQGLTPPANAAAHCSTWPGCWRWATTAMRRPTPRGAPSRRCSTLLYTSGTSGRPKGVMLSEDNNFWGATNFIHGNAVNSGEHIPVRHAAVPYRRADGGGAHAAAGGRRCADFRRLRSRADPGPDDGPGPGRDALFLGPADGATLVAAARI